jgi:ABC-type dipeptide/oligopeptide/nickel transport system permease subunit
MRIRWLKTLCILWLGAMVLMALFAPIISSADPYKPIGSPLQSPRDHPPLGTDALGRDFFARVTYGARLSLSIPLLATLLTVLIGTAVSLTAIVVGGLSDRLILALTNAALAIPGLLLAMLLVAGFGPGIPTVVIAVGLGGIPGFVRLSRSIFLGIKEMGYIDAAYALGASRTRVALAHLLPNAAPQLFSLATTHFAWAFMGATTLTFLGLSGDPSVPEWGAMLNSGRLHLVQAPWLTIIPGILISLTILTIHYLGENYANK